MALTILQRPIGVILDTCVDATINQDYNGFATVNKTAHGLLDNQWVYIQCDVETYNGFWQIDVINSGEFALKNYDGSYVSYTVSASISYCPQVATHGYSCVHLPITYRISNNRWPVNSIDTVRTISTLNDDLGYARVTLSGTLGTFEDLSFVKISNAANSGYNGVYQILDKLSTSNVTLNVAYNSFTNSGLIGASIQLYYGNYNVVVQVYAGINSSHTWASEKPYELAATLELIPDNDNQVLFSINEILKAYIQTKNNLQLVSLPNNIDFWTNFYISISEQYDSSDGYTIGTTQTGFNSDQLVFEGTAVNAMLPFKNIHSGYLSEYIMRTSAGKFLTMFAIPVLFSCGDDTPDCYSDISFIFPELELSKFEIRSNNASKYQTTNLSASQSDWVLSTASVTMNVSNPVSTEIMYQTINDPAGTVYSMHYQASGNGTYTAGGGNALNLFVGFFDSSYNLLSGSAQLLSANGSSTNSTGTVILTVPAGAVYLGFRGSAATIASGSYTLQVQSFISNITQFIKQEYYSNGSLQTTISEEINTDGPGVYRFELDANCLYDRVDITLVEYVDGVAGDEISATKTFEIDCGCSPQDIVITWLNPLGGFDYWNFTGETGYAVDVESTIETNKNIFPEWPKSYGENADTIRKQVSRESANRLFITSQYLTEDQADALAYIKTSPLVQIINSRTDRRTIIVDSDSFTVRTDNQKLITISFNARYTDNIGSQKV